MSFVNVTAQSLASGAFVSLMEFDFTSIGGSAHVYIADGKELIGGQPQLADIMWTDGVIHEFDWVDFTWTGLRSDLTGFISEPTLRVAALTLWENTAWANAVNNFTLMDYRGLRVKRQRMFYNTPTLIAPQSYFIKSVDELNDSEIAFTLTPSLGMENASKPSARKLEL